MLPHESYPEYYARKPDAGYGLVAADGRVLEPFVYAEDKITQPWTPAYPEEGQLPRPT
jgi:hypothetical protein